MDHPLTSNRIAGLIYGILAVTIGIAQAAYTLVYYALPAGVAIADGLIFGVVLGILGTAIWYVVRYNDPEKSTAIQILLSHVAGSIVFNGMWILISGILVKLFINLTLYDNYLFGQVSGRISGGFLFYVLLVFLYYIYVYIQHNREKQSREEEWQNQIREARLNALKFQINPHFLFNSLNSVASLTLTNPEKAHGMVIALSEFMRYSLRKQQDDMVPLELELNNIGLYLQIEKIRFGDNLSYRFEMDELCRSCLIPNLILQPLFENAIKYGVYEASKPVEILLEAKKHPGILEITVVNDIDPESVPVKGEGVGLTNISDRLRLLYGSAKLLTAELSENQFKVTILIPDRLDNRR